MTFQGFEEIQINSIPVPKDLVDILLSEITSLAELKVTLFIIRNTYGNATSFTCISLNEFINGICDEKGITVCKGVGLARQHIIRGVSLAEGRGTILVYKRGSKGREEKWYLLNTPENKKIVQALENNQITMEELLNGQKGMLAFLANGK